MTRGPQSRLVRQHSRGPALLLAMILLTLVATVAAGMVWQQSRAIEVEGAERARAQATWMLLPSVDLARDVARRLSNTTPGSDLSNQPWDMRVDELKLSTLLAADRDNSADATLDVMSGAMVDAQSRYNLTNLFRKPRHNLRRRRRSNRHPAVKLPIMPACVTVLCKSFRRIALPCYLCCVC